MSEGKQQVEQAVKGAGENARLIDDLLSRLPMGVWAGARGQVAEDVKTLAESIGELLEEERGRLTPHELIVTLGLTNAIAEFAVVFAEPRTKSDA